MKIYIIFDGILTQSKMLVERQLFWIFWTYR